MLLFFDSLSHFFNNTSDQSEPDTFFESESAFTLSYGSWNFGTKVSKEKLSGDIIGKLNASRERAQRRLTLKEILADRSGMDACKHLRALNKK